MIRHAAFRGSPSDLDGVGDRGELVVPARGPASGRRERPGALRDRHTPSDVFRELTHRMSLLLVAEATRDLPLGEHTIETALEATTVHPAGIGDFGDWLFGT
jgi:hypothetical protein